MKSRIARNERRVFAMVLFKPFSNFEVDVEVRNANGTD